MPGNKIDIIVVAGPTSSGKSDLAITLARKFNGEIISADSRQVYRGMDIGTGKVTKREQRLARHWLLDVASPKHQYSVTQWVAAAQRAIANIVRRGKLPIVCGGTGFWIDALVFGLQIPIVRPDPALRARLNKLSATQLFARLRRLDPVRAAGIDPHNPRRLVRALEIVLTTGKPVPARDTNGSPYEPLYLAISLPKDELNRRIKKRLDARLRAGMAREVNQLHASGVSWKRLESLGLEYRWVSRYLQGTLTRDAMHTGLLRDIVHYAKRQMTWWHRNRDIRWVSSSVQAVRLARRFVKRYSVGRR